MGDSLGGRTYIDRSEPRSCSGSCLCWDLDKRVDSEFVFTASKTKTSIDVTINSVVLNSYLARLLGRSCQDLVCQVHDGFELLRNLDSLMNQLHNLRTEMQDRPPVGQLTNLLFEQDVQLETELGLLLEGFVQDHQVFQSFDYENLYEKGYLSYDRWKAFQCSSSHLNIDRLDSAFHATSDEGRHPLRTNIAARTGSATTVKLLLEDGDTANPFDPFMVKLLPEDGDTPNAFDPSMHQLVSVPLVEAIKHKNQEVVDQLIEHGANVNGLYPDTHHSPLISALVNGNTSAIAKLLCHGVNLKILGMGEITVADRWRFAATLLEHGISADSILEALPESMDKRLLGVLFREGGDVMKSPSYMPISRYVYFSGRVAASGSQLEDAQRADPDSHQIKCWRLEFSEAVEAVHGLASFTTWRSRADESLVAGDDSHRTKELHRTYHQTKALVRAIRTRDQVSVDLHVQNGANPTLGLTAALQTHDSKILKLLLDAGAELNYVAEATAKLSLVTAIKAGDRGFVKCLLAACAPHTLLKNLDFVLDGQTPLMVAVLHNDAYIAQHLIGMGANPTFPTNGHSCFAIARENGFNDMLQILLRGTRISRHRVSPSSEGFLTLSVPDAYKFLDKTYTREDNQKLADSVSKEIRLRHLRLLFRTEHSHITACASAYPLTWGCGFDADYSKAWNSGTAVMRKLCAGKLPQSLNEIIMFLAVAKAICLSGSVPMLRVWHSHFASDLARWQTLFEETDGSLSAFQQAVSSIWGIQLDKLDHVGTPDSETLTYFHELATSLADSTDLYLNLRDREKRLLASQSRWRSHISWVSLEYRINGLTQALAFLRQTKEAQYVETPPTRISQAISPDRDTRNRVPLWEALHYDPRVHTFSTKATLLMVGFIFGAVLAFLLCTGSRCSISSWNAADWT